MATRTIDVNAAIVGRSVRIHFRVVCDSRAQLIGEQTFRISATGCESVDFIPVGSSIVNHAESLTTVNAIVRNLNFDQTLTRLRKLPNVSNIRVE